MDDRGKVESAAFFVEQPAVYDENELGPSANNSTTTENSSSASSNWLVVEATTSVYDPCADAISSYVCINSAQLAIICIACFTVIAMIVLRVVFCCCKRRRKQKKMPDILVGEGDIIRTRLNSVSTIAGNPPPRYSQIFDQDGISVFEEVPPDYETTQPDLLKSLPQNLSRTSSLASKGQPNEQNGEGDSQPAVTPGQDTATSSVSTEAAREGSETNGVAQGKPKAFTVPISETVVPLSINNLFRDSRQVEVTC